MSTHIQIIAWLHLILGGLAALCGVLVLLVLLGIGSFAAASGGHEGLVGFTLFGGFGTFLMVLAIVMALPDLLVGWGLLARRQWARILCIVISILHLLSGVGILLGVYSLVVLLMPEGAREFS
jgi:hypothetical protein